MYEKLLSLFVWLQSEKSEKGQDLAEYGLLVALIAFIVIAGVVLFGNNLLAFFNKIGGTVATW